ncbi:DUF2255 family protein [Actinomadura luteofluorescens]|uniref:DUF2255 family protein n=1 Tax=Actinomadura luteofluorescens TaxID=46163 RepID=UPI003480EC43
MSTITWSRDELADITEASELEIEPARDDGSLKDPTTIWVVRDGDDLYVRSYRGADGSWYRTTQQRHQGRIQAGGVTKDVSLVNVGDDVTLNDRIDAAYHGKYDRYGAAYVDPMVADTARATTLKLVPRQ